MAENAAVVMQSIAQEHTRSYDVTAAATRRLACLRLDIADRRHDTQTQSRDERIRTTAWSSRENEPQI